MDRADMKARTSEVVRLFPTFVCKTQLDKATYEPLNQTIRAQLPQWPGTRAGGGLAVGSRAAQARRPARADHLHRYRGVQRPRFPQDRRKRVRDHRLLGERA